MHDRLELAPSEKDSINRAKRSELKSITVKRNVAIVGVTTGLSACLGFVVHVLVARYFGASSALDAFLVAFVLLYFIQNQFQAGDLLNSSFIPVYNLALCESEEKAAKFFNTIILSMWLMFSILSILCLILAPFLIQLAGHGLPSQEKILTVRIFRLLALVLPIVGMTGVLASLMRAEGRFFAPAAGPLVINLLVIFMIFGFSTKYGIMSYVLGWLLGCIGQFAIVIKPLFKTPGFSLRNISWKCNYVRGFFKRIGLLILDVPIGLILLALERSFGSALGPGTVSHLNYARVVYTAPLNLLAVPIQTVMFSKFSQLAALGNHAELRDHVEKTLRITVLLILPVIAFVIFFRQEIVCVLFERGSFSRLDTARTSTLLFYFGISMLAVGIWWLFRQVSYALGDMISPLLAGLVGLIIYFIGSQLFIDKMGASALALNWAVSFFLSDLLLGGILVHKLGGRLNRRMIFFSFKIGVATCVVFLFLQASTNFYPEAHRSTWSILSYLLRYGLASIILYIFAAWLMRIEEVKDVAILSKREISKFVRSAGENNV